MSRKQVTRLMAPGILPPNISDPPNVDNRNDTTLPSPPSAPRELGDQRELDRLATDLVEKILCCASPIEAVNMAFRALSAAHVDGFARGTIVARGIITDVLGTERKSPCDGSR